MISSCFAYVRLCDSATLQIRHHAAAAVPAAAAAGLAPASWRSSVSLHEHMLRIFLPFKPQVGERASAVSLVHPPSRPKSTGKRISPDAQRRPTTRMHHLPSLPGALQLHRAHNMLCTPMRMTDGKGSHTSSGISPIPLAA